MSLLQSHYPDVTASQRRTAKGWGTADSVTVTLTVRPLTYDVGMIIPPLINKEIPGQLLSNLPGQRDPSPAVRL